ncbi:pi-PLC X domain plant-like protein [Trifolium medium]|uniref:Pi-PLC X domain plant-like protein n=1 Tax=Trifolium medium TaxID=97028 RepID=A0A392MKE8_9FABA|nr:pi-PLC X domain plant-like protein [Trifolium medium]
MEAGASFGSCKNISVPSTSPVSSTSGSGSFTGSVQFSKSASPVRYPNSVLVFLFHFMLIAVLLKL